MVSYNLGTDEGVDEFHGLVSAQNTVIESLVRSIRARFRFPYRASEWNVPLTQTYGPTLWSWIGESEWPKREEKIIEQQANEDILD